VIEVEQDELADYTVDPPVRGNCLAACVASIFEVPLDDLALIYDNRTLGFWLRGAQPALTYRHQDHGRLGEDLVWRAAPVALGSVMPDVSTLRALWIATVKSPRIEATEDNIGLHAVVMRGREVAWDPHPARSDGVGAQYAMTWFELIDPGRLR
jgi:hypothetical protein